MASVAKAAGDAAIRASVSLPRTTLPMRAAGASRELRHVERLTGELYRRQLARPDVGSRPPFVLHDGPPYANGSLHMGHLLNKVLKDAVNRYRLLRGDRVVFVPGWDCHGLPIELKALQGQGQAAAGAGAGASSSPSAASSSLPPLEIRRRARACAEEAIEGQRRDFERWGVLADWDVAARAERGNVYVTMDAHYEAEQLRVFGSLVERGLVHRARAPVYWSPSSCTALAEAELEYAEAHVSTAAYVAFPLASAEAVEDARIAALLRGDGDGAGVHAVIWTTTPWTLPANVAIAVHPALSYAIVERVEGGGAAGDGRSAPSRPLRYLVASDLVAHFSDKVIAAPVRVVADGISGASLLGCEFAHPLQDGGTGGLSSAAEAEVGTLFRPAGKDGRVARVSTVIPGAYVTAESGTGLVHTAPGHGHDDFAACREWNRAKTSSSSSLSPSPSKPAPSPLPVLCPVDDHGRFTPSAGPAFAGLSVLGDGNAAVLAALASSGLLLASGKHVHRYPYDWRTKKPVVIRATEQWFVRVGDVLPRCAEAVAELVMVPPSSRQRLAATLGGRTEWCISRQRSWGVPIPALYRVDTGAPLLTKASVDHVRSLLRERGSDAWWTLDAEVFLPPDVAEAARRDGVAYRKGTDTLDVWFDSGTSWAAAWATASSGGTGGGDPRGLAASSASPNPPPSDLILEGSDQHRGWFQSSLITGVAATGRAPYKGILTHGFVLDEKMRKMSKSLGNVIAPAEIIEGKKAGGAEAAGKSGTAAPAPKAGGKAGKGAGGGGKGGGASSPPTAAEGGGQGVDVLRYWACSADASGGDVTLGPSVLAITADTLRKVRHTLRFLLSALHDFDLAEARRALAGGAGAGVDAPRPQSLDPVHAAWSLPPLPLVASVAGSSRGSPRVGLLESALLHRLAAFDREARGAFDALAFAQAVAALNSFTSADLSAAYVDTAKDRLYCDEPARAGGSGGGAARGGQSVQRRLAVQAALWECLRTVARVLAPIAPFTAEDVYQHSALFLLPHAETGAVSGKVVAAGAGAAGAGADPADVLYAPASTIFDSTWQPLPEAWHQPAVGAAWDALLHVRGEVNAVLEAARQAKDIGAPSDARVELSVPRSGRLGALLGRLRDEGTLGDFFLTSQVDVLEVEAEAEGGGGDEDGGGVRRSSAEGGAPGSAYVRASKVSVRAEALEAVGGSAAAGTAAAERLVVRVTRAAGGKCVRCRLHREEVEVVAVPAVPAVGTSPSLCNRCAAAVRAYGGV